MPRLYNVVFIFPCQVAVKSKRDVARCNLGEIKLKTILARSRPFPQFRSRLEPSSGAPEAVLCLLNFLSVQTPHPRSHTHPPFGEHWVFSTDWLRGKVLVVVAMCMDTSFLLLDFLMAPSTLKASGSSKLMYC